MKLASIQVLRAIAAIMVVYTHSISQTGLWLGGGWQQKVPLRSSLGTFGVDLFFVISGFIISLTAARLKGPAPALRFLWHRFRRINPVYYLALLLTLITWIPSLVRHQRAFPSGGDFLAWAVLLPVAADHGQAVSQAWTLSFEWYFYLLFFVFVLTRVSWKSLGLCLVIISATFAGIFLPAGRAGMLAICTDPLMIEFCLGIGIAAIYRRGKLSNWAARSLLWAGILIAGFLLVTGSYDFLAIGAPDTAACRYGHAVIWGAAAALIVAGAVSLEKNQAAVLRRLPGFFIRLGDASYSIYIFHLLIFGGLGALYLRVHLDLNADWMTPVHAILAIGGCLILYRYAERPLLRRLSS